MNINLDIEGLETASKSLKAHGEEFQAVIEAMDKLISDLPEVWSGNAAIAYGEQFDALKSSSLLPTRELIEDIGLQIDDVLEKSKELDQNIANQLN